MWSFGIGFSQHFSGDASELLCVSDRAFVCIAKPSPRLGTHHSVLSHSPVEGQWGGFQFGAPTHKAAQVLHGPIFHSSKPQQRLVMTIGWDRDSCFSDQILLIRGVHTHVSAVSFLLPSGCSSFFYYFLSVWRTSFGQFLLEGLLVTHSSTFPLSRNICTAPPHSWGIISPDIEFAMRIFLSGREKQGATCFWLPWFWTRHLSFLQECILSPAVFKIFFFFFLSSVFKSFNSGVCPRICVCVYVGIYPIWGLLSFLNL